ncbi:gamma-glutamyl phosphate reductase [Pirellula staleyi DSM 6068]|uniref:Gamma-glutamyl phosphate reductase n=1 Tax=Pirellula staleyi (strain ATCC 27377 / DSM 6068 / ICPB 4128) TaxID=530564 RepID=D2R067_PIRSD|nr:glutamate-5-semialdehyde dehydrogenase [Pirellula staleyi]ADB18432.1 gamma-glutamyl phosphate reductase [Pirellula staleyi DSM 6068]
MAIAEQVDLASYCLETARKAKRASRALAAVSGAVRNHWLRESAAALRASIEPILAANQLDLAAAPSYGLTDAAIDRLKLTPARIEDIAIGLEQVAALPDPLGEIIESSIRPSGIDVQKVRCPLGVVFFIYESRPNVTADAAAICLKSGNAVILRGGKEALHSSQAIVSILVEVADRTGIPAGALQLVDTTDRAAVGHFLKLDGEIDVAIPRGGEGLIRRVVEEARMPVIKHFNGNCHVYVDQYADLAIATKVTINSKCHRLGVCNAAESLLVHQDVAAAFLPMIAPALTDRGIELRGCEATRQIVPTAKPATDEDFFTEYLGPIISIKVVASLEAAIEHINHYGSKHTDAIITRDLAASRKFAVEVDSAAVMINASTRFNDGFQFGLGAEIGISTDKFHARGPCGLKELTTYKYVVYGEGQIRE